MATILNGKDLSERMAQKLVTHIKNRNIKATLVIIQIGSVKESNTYIQKKKDFAEKLGVRTIHKRYPKYISEETVIKDIQSYNRNKDVHGIMVQLPIPEKLNTERVIEAIASTKDVDGLTSTNTKLLFDNEEAYIPATTQGILTLLEEQRVELKGKKVVIVGESALVGRPTLLALLNRRATVTVCHVHTKNLEQETRRADILIVAAGVPKLITDRYVAKGQIVIDVGITILPNKKVVGDVAYKKVQKIVKANTPVPGGVGPMTVLSLFQNIIKAYHNQNSK